MCAGDGSQSAGGSIPVGLSSGGFVDVVSSGVSWGVSSVDGVVSGPAPAFIQGTIVAGWGMVSDSSSSGPAAIGSPTEVVAAMFARDPQAQHLDVRVEHVSAGTVTLHLMAAARHTGDHGLIHGGVLFTFADIAMAYASNSYDITALATGAQISFVDSGHPGELLVATATEHSLRGKVGIYDVTVHARDQDSLVAPRLVATFRGTTLRVGGSVANLEPRPSR